MASSFPPPSPLPLSRHTALFYIKTFGPVGNLIRTFNFRSKKSLRFFVRKFLIRDICARSEILRRAEPWPERLLDFALRATLARAFSRANNTFLKSALINFFEADITPPRNRDFSRASCSQNTLTSAIYNFCIEIKRAICSLRAPLLMHGKN